MEKLFFVILLISLGSGVLFGSYKFFQDEDNQLGDTYINLPEADKIIPDNRKFQSQISSTNPCQSTFYSHTLFPDSNQFQTAKDWNSLIKPKIEIPHLNGCFNEMTAIGSNILPH